MALIDSLIVFLVSLGIGALGIHVGAKIISGESDYGSAIITALIGSLVWGIVSFFVGGIPLLGPVLTYLAWLAVIKSRYKGGWINAAGIALIGWLTAVIVLYLLASLGVGAFEAVGIPETT